MHRHFFDVTVIGAGPAGTLAAICFARAGKTVALLDRAAGEHKQPPTQIKVGESVPAAINKVLQKLNLNPLDATIHRPIPGSESLWAGEYVQQDFIQHTQGMGWRLDRIAFEKDLLQQAIQNGVELLPAWLNDLHHDGKTWQIKTDHGDFLHSECIIDASGRAAVVARKLASPRTKGPPLVTLWAVGEPTDTAIANLTAQTLTESQAEGWWYAAHLPDGRPLALFHTNARYAAELRRQPQKWWQQLTNTQLLQKKLNTQNLKNAELQTHEARTIILQQPYGNHWAACGDAALSFDPLSSQGIFNALVSGHMVSQAILSEDRQTALQHYHGRLKAIAEIYQQRRLGYYRRGCEFYHGEFWTEQLGEPLVWRERQQQVSSV